MTRKTAEQRLAPVQGMPEYVDLPYGVGSKRRG